MFEIIDLVEAKSSTLLETRTTEVTNSLLKTKYNFYENN